jgi:dephospho-CoA kinase
MLVVGLTGGIASGKSMVSGILRSLGACIIDADVIAHELIRPGLPAWQEIVGQFGQGILLEDCRINRPILGRIIFRDPAKRAVLNSILHPRIFEEVERQRKEIERKSPDAIVILDAALLIETGAHETVDVVILVQVSEDLQIKRLMERNRLTREEAIERIKAQASLEERKRYAGYIIDASKSPEDVKLQTTELFEKLKVLSRRSKKPS